MGLLDQPTKLALGHRQSLLSIDLLDQRKLRGRQSRQREAASPRLDRDPLAFRAERDARLFRQRFENIEQLAAGDRYVTALLDVHHARGYELHFEISSG